LKEKSFEIFIFFYFLFSSKIFKNKKNIFFTFFLKKKVFKNLFFFQNFFGSK